MLRRLWSVVRGLLAFIGLVVVVLLILSAGAFQWLRANLAEWRPLPASILLTADLRGSLPEVPSSDLRSLLPGRPELTLAQAVLALDRAAADPRVDALLVRLDEGGSLAQAEELRQAVARFRAAGKRAWAWSDGFGELSPGNAGYLLATGFERIVLQPAGTVGLTGVALEIPYLKGLFDRLGIGLEVTRRAEYKTAFDSFARDRMSAPEREMLEAVVDTLHARLVAGLDERLGRGEAAARVLIDGGPYAAAEAERQGLVDALGWYDAVEAELSGSLRDAATLALEDYAARLTDPAGATKRVALIQAAGPIVRGSGGGGFSQDLIAADDLAEAIADAAEDPAIDAIVLRVDSPGGSPAASETIARAVRNAEEAGRPVIVSMGEVAASGGYWISKDASAIAAVPTTLTGSIGVITLKPDLSRLSAEQGIVWEQVRRGDHAGLWSIGRPYTNAEAARADDLVRELYDDFTNGVAQGRNLAPERVREIAKGRVWTGQDAKGLGLVDDTGGLLGALALVRRELGLPADAPLAVSLRPEPDTLERLVLQAIGLEAATRALASTLALTLGLIEPGAKALAPPLVVR